MNFNYPQLRQHLQSEALHPAYLLSSDEPLQLQRASDVVRKKAMQQGFTNHQLFFLNDTGDWQAIFNCSLSGSLFADKTLVDIRLTSQGPGKKGANALAQWFAQNNPEAMLLMQMGRMKPATKNSAWVKSFQKHGVFAQFWPLNPGETKRWISDDARRLKLDLRPPALEQLATFFEGNLLAAQQELRKLAVLYPDQPITETEVTQVCADHARFDVYEWQHAVLMQDHHRADHVFEHIRLQGIDINIVLWSLQDIVNTVAKLDEGLAKGEALPTLIKKIPWKAQAAYRTLMQRRSKIPLHQIIEHLCCLELHIKGRHTEYSRSKNWHWQQANGISVMLMNHHFSLPNAC